jgi:Outer membrane protein beta-barrel domain
VRSLVPLLVLMVIGVPSIAAAQKREIGAKVGPNLAVMMFDPDDEFEVYERRIAVRGGVFAVLPVTKRLAAQIEILFSPKGGRVRDELAPGIGGKVLLEYVDFPALARIEGPTLGSNSIHVFGGPYAGIRTGATRQISNPSGSIEFGTREDMGQEIKRWDFGLVAGAGVNVGRRVVFDGRYAWGMTNVNTNTSEGVRVRNRVFTILGGVRF